MTDGNGALPESEYPEFIKSFDKCPACGSTERFFETLAAEVKEKGLVGEDFRLYLEARHNVVVDKIKEISMGVGSQIPAFAFLSDICEDCGCIYAVKIQRMIAVKQLAPPPLIIPNREQRRRMGDKGEFFTPNNPLLS